MRATPGSLRIRLTIWYSVILACGLLLFAAAIWVLLKQALYKELQRSLAERTGSLQAFVEQEAQEPGVKLTEELEEYCHALPAGTYFWISGLGPGGMFASDAGFKLPGSSDESSRDAVWKVWLLPHYLSSHATLTLPSHTTLTLPPAGLQLQITGLIATQRERFILRQLGLLLMTVAPAVLLISAFGGFALSRRALRPVDEITVAARMLSMRDLSGRLPVPRTGDELQRLSETWNGMLDRVQDAVERLSRFTQDASHELRTPLAIIRSTAEIASRRSRPEEAYRIALHQIVEESDRLTALVEDLLLLARGEQADKPAMQKLSLTDLVSEVCREMSALSRQKDVTLATELGEQPAYLHGNRALLRRLLVVLLDNAIQYSPRASVVTVQLLGDDERLALRVEDAGIGIAERDKAHIFERFYRGEAAREAWGKGAGLGLSLAASIAQQHQAEIEFGSGARQGSVFTVRFPAQVARLSG